MAIANFVNTVNGALYEVPTRNSSSQTESELRNITNVQSRLMLLDAQNISISTNVFLRNGQPTT